MCSVEDEVEAFFALSNQLQRAHLHALISFRNEVHASLGRVNQLTAGGVVGPASGRGARLSPRVPALATPPPMASPVASPVGNISAPIPNSVADARKASDAAMYAAAQAAAQYQDSARGTLHIKGACGKVLRGLWR
jgi:hypothetical protein